MFLPVALTGPQNSCPGISGGLMRFCATGPSCIYGDPCHRPRPLSPLRERRRDQSGGRASGARQRPARPPVLRRQAWSQTFGFLVGSSEVGKLIILTKLLSALRLHILYAIDGMSRAPCRMVTICNGDVSG